MESVQSLADAVFVTNQFGENYLHEINAGVFNQVGSDTFYRSYFADHLFLQDEFYVVIGSDCGLLANYVQHIGVPKGTRYLFIELQSVLDKLEQLGNQHYGNKIQFTNLDNWQDCAKKMGIFSYLSLDNARVMKSVAALDAYWPRYREFSNNIEGEFHQFAWFAKSNFSGYTFIEQQLRNLAENQIPAIALADSFSGKTAIILAGGPSLDSFLPWVKQHRGQLLVVAVSRISQRLIDVDLIPDIIVAIDPNEKMFEISKSMLLMEPKPLLAVGYHVISTLLGQYSNKHVYLGARFPWHSNYCEENINVQGPTVTNAALTLLIEMGVEQILLAGVDLCYSQQGYSHAQGSGEHKRGPRIDFVGQKVLLNDGSIGETEHAFFAAINVMADQAKCARDKGCQVINLCNKAAKIDNVDYFPIEKITINPVEKSSRLLLQELFQRHPYQDKEKHCRRCISELKKVQKRLREVIDISEKIITLNKKINKQNLAKIDNLEKKLKKNHKDLLITLKEYGYRNFLDMYRATKEESWSSQEIVQATESCFSGYVVSAKELLKEINQTVLRLNSRIQGSSQVGCFKNLAKQWQKDNQPGRALLWREQNSAAFAELDQYESELFIELEKDYVELIEQPVESLGTDLKDYQSFKNVQSKLYGFFKEKRVSELKQMQVSLQSFEGEESEALQNLTQAYLAEIMGDMDLAIELYYSAAKSHVMEFALNHLISLLLKNNDPKNALLALECLVEIAPGYMPQFAQLSYLLGDEQQAILAYEQYIEQAPNDVAVLIKLAKLYQELAQHSQARDCLEKIISKHPEHQGAKQMLEALVV